MENLTASGPEPVKERPMLFTGPMAKAIWAGDKTQTRRIFSDKLVLNQEPGRYKFHYYGECDGLPGLGACFEDLRPEITPWITPIACPYGEPGERLWLRENIRAEEVEGLDGIRYVADDVFIAQPNTPEAADAWVNLYHYGKKRSATVPNIHMPRWASRLLLEITAVRVERVQDISEKDAKAEGTTPLTESLNCLDRYRVGYEHLWTSLHGPGSWDANPWVWVVEFKEVSRAKYRELVPVAAAPAPTESAPELAATPELQALLDKHPAARAALFEAYGLGMGDLREVVGALGKPELPLPTGRTPALCINDMPGPFVRFLNVVVAAQHLKHWWPFGIQADYFSKDELRGLRFLESHLDTFLRNACAVLVERRIFAASDQDATGSHGLQVYLTGLADILGEMLSDLNTLGDPRTGHTAMRMYTKLNMVTDVPAEKWDELFGVDAEAVEVGEELVHG